MVRFAECSHRGVEFFAGEVVVENYFHLLAFLRSLSESGAVQDDDVRANDAPSEGHRYVNIYNITRTIELLISSGPL